MQRTASVSDVIPPALRVLAMTAFAAGAYGFGDFAYEAWIGVSSPNERLFEVVRMGGLSLVMAACGVWLALRGTGSGLRHGTMGMCVVQLVAAWVAVAYPREHAAPVTPTRIAVLAALTLAVIPILVWAERSYRRMRSANAAGEEAA